MLFADAPANWPDPPPTSLLHTLLVFVGIPLLITVVIAVLVMAPSLVKGPRYSPGQPWDAESEWFGAPEQAAVEPGTTSAQLTGSTRATTTIQDAGGASARW